MGQLWPDLVEKREDPAIGSSTSQTAEAAELKSILGAILTRPRKNGRPANDPSCFGSLAIWTPAL